MPAPAGTDYSSNQLQRALDAAARVDEANGPESQGANQGKPGQALARVRRWRAVVEGLLSGKLAVGTRQPVDAYPEWVSLEITTGGFATGSALAAGPLLPHEHKLLNELQCSDAPSPRLALNRYFLSEAGQQVLLHALQTQGAAIDLAEEAVLPLVAWLAAHDHADLAAELVDTVAPFAHELRFYPRLDATFADTAGHVHLNTVGDVVHQLRSVRPKPQVLAQRATVCTWTPLYDAAIGLVLDTVDGEAPLAQKDGQGGWARGERGQFVVHGGWPFKTFPMDWKARVRQLIAQHELALSQHAPPARFSGSNEPFVVLMNALGQAANDPSQLTGRIVGRVRLILARYVAVRGIPGSETALAERALQQSHAGLRTHQDIAFQVADQLAACNPAGGLESMDAVLAGQVTSAPACVMHRLQRCLYDTPAGLIERGIVPSSEALASLLPQQTSQLRALAFDDAALRTLYAATYRAFRQRRSLLLLTMQRQVQFDDLPWVAMMNRFRDANVAAARAADAALVEFACLTVASFPQTALPNKLLQEFSSLAEDAGHDLPFTEELAVDIFMGSFSDKFVAAARIAAADLADSLYARYYRIDYDSITRQLSGANGDPETVFARLCAKRAGNLSGLRYTVANGRIIEQQMILSTHNMALLVQLPGVRETLADQADELAKRCFAWILRQLQLPDGGHMVALHRLKNAAYAWRQMVFLLSLRESAIEAFLADAYATLHRQPAEFVRRFSPLLQGLRLAAYAPDAWRADASQQPFLGWQQSTLHPEKTV